MNLMFLAAVVALLGAQASNYDPRLCATKLAEAGLSPYEPTLTVAGPASSGPDMYQPFQGIVCRNSRTGEMREFPPARQITDCESLHQQDPSWDLANAYNCVGALKQD